jgi:hypothetical protein
MSASTKKIDSYLYEDGTIVTKTSGNAGGFLADFDVSVLSPPKNHKKATNLTINVGGVSINLNGRQFRTLARIAREHEDAVDNPTRTFGR